MADNGVIVLDLGRRPVADDLLCPLRISVDVVDVQSERFKIMNARARKMF